MIFYNLNFSYRISATVGAQQTNWSVDYGGGNGKNQVRIHHNAHGDSEADFSLLYGCIWIYQKNKYFLKNKQSKAEARIERRPCDPGFCAQSATTGTVPATEWHILPL